MNRRGHLRNLNLVKISIWTSSVNQGWMWNFKVSHLQEITMRPLTFQQAKTMFRSWMREDILKSSMRSTSSKNNNKSSMIKLKWLSQKLTITITWTFKGLILVKKSNRNQQMLHKTKCGLKLGKYSWIGMKKLSRRKTPKLLWKLSFSWKRVSSRTEIRPKHKWLRKRAQLPTMIWLWVFRLWQTRPTPNSTRAKMFTILKVEREVHHP